MGCGCSKEGVAEEKDTIVRPEHAFPSVLSAASMREVSLSVKLWHSSNDLQEREDADPEPPPTAQLVPLRVEFTGAGPGQLQLLFALKGAIVVRAGGEERMLGEHRRGPVERVSDGKIVAQMRRLFAPGVIVRLSDGGQVGVVKSPSAGGTYDVVINKEGELRKGVEIEREVRDKKMPDWAGDTGNGASAWAGESVGSEAPKWAKEARIKVRKEKWAGEAADPKRVYQDRFKWVGPEVWRRANDWLDETSALQARVLGRLVEIRPTAMVYAAAIGTRIGLCSAESHHLRCATVVSVGADDGAATVRIDNAAATVSLELRPSTVVLAPTPVYPTETKLMVINDGRFVDAAVIEEPKLGSRHTLRLGANPTLVEMDLNEMNACTQRFADVAEYETARSAYCDKVVREWSKVEDAITGVSLDLETQLLQLTTDAGTGALEMDAAEMDKMEPADLRWEPVTHVEQLQKGMRIEVLGEYRRVQDFDEIKSAVNYAGPLQRIRRAVPMCGLQAQEYVNTTDVGALVPRLLAEGGRRAEGGHTGHPVLIRAKPGTGKTWAMLQLRFLIAKTLRESPPKGAPPLVPYLVSVQKLVRVMRLAAMDDAGSRVAGESMSSTASMPSKPSTASVSFDGSSMCSKRTAASDDGRADRDGGALLSAYMDAEVSDGTLSAGDVKMLRQSFDARTLLLLIDGVDEAADLSGRVERWAVHELVPRGHRVVLTSRPEGVRMREYRRNFIVLNLKPLSQEQQDKVIAKQLEGNKFYDHLFAFSRIREHHDKLYEDHFSLSERAALESFEAPNLLKPKGGQYDPDIRQRFGARFIQLQPDAPVSEYYKSGEGKKLTAALCDAKFQEGLTQFALRPKSGGEAEAAVIKQELSKLAEAGGKDVERLALLFCKLHKMHEAKTMGELWTKIVSRTDELLSANEAARPIFDSALDELRRVCCDPHDVAAVELAPLKDPVRIHEKAIDDYEGRFDDDVLAEANVLDVVRARLVLNDGCAVLKALKLLKGGLKFEFEGAPAQLSLVRCKGKFGEPDPTHFRNALLNLLLIHRGRRYFAELQVHQKDILDYQDASHAHYHYEFFRARLSSHLYDKTVGGGIDFILEQRMKIFAEISQTPVLLSMLVVCMSASAGGSSLPEDIFDLYDKTIHAVAERRFPDDKDKNKVFVLVRLLQAIACANMLSDPPRRVFEYGDATTALASDREAFALWQMLLNTDKGVPLIKTLSAGNGKGEFEFKHLSLQEALLARALHYNEAKAREHFWADDAMAVKRLKEPFFTSTFSIGSGHVGQALAEHRPDWRFAFGEISSPQAWEALDKILKGATQLRSLTVSLPDKDISPADKTAGVTDGLSEPSRAQPYQHWLTTPRLQHNFTSATLSVQLMSNRGQLAHFKQIGLAARLITASNGQQFVEAKGPWEQLVEAKENENGLSAIYQVQLELPASCPAIEIGYVGRLGTRVLLMHGILTLRNQSSPTSDASGLIKA